VAGLTTAARSSATAGLWGGIMWTWHWQLFLAATVLGYFLIGYARRTTNKSMIEKHGSRADYRSAEPAANMVGTFFASAILAAIVTAITGFLF
jgi:hypothetical protein